MHFFGSSDFSVGRLCYSTKVLYRLYFCTISFCNFLQIKTHFYCFLYFHTSSRAQGPWLGQTTIHKDLLSASHGLEGHPLHHTAHWLVNSLAHKLSTTIHHPGGEKLAKSFCIYSLSKNLCFAYTMPGTHLLRAPATQKWPKQKSPPSWI